MSIFNSQFDVFEKKIVVSQMSIKGVRGVKMTTDWSERRLWSQMLAASFRRHRNKNPADISSARYEAKSVLQVNAIPTSKINKPHQQPNNRRLIYERPKTIKLSTQPTFSRNNFLQLRVN